MPEIDRQPGGASAGSAECLSQDLLEVIAGGGQGSEAAKAHVESCAACREHIARIRAVEAAVASFARAGNSYSGTSAEDVPPTVPLALNGNFDITPDIVPGYRILGPIHSGGQGVVYKAIDLAMHRTVAIKMLLAGRFATPVQRRRFEREAEISASLKHPNIVTVYHTLPVRGDRYAIVMEHIDGVTLGRWPRTPPAYRNERQRFAAEVRLLLGVCDAVQHAHNNGVIHRDLKPGNILIEEVADEQGAADAPRPRVVDFGLARSTAINEATLASPGEFAGSIHYASPEQVLLARAGEDEPVARTDARSDIYSLGVILYERICGRLPFKAEGSFLELMNAVVDQAAPPPSTVVRGVDADLDTIVLRALHKDPSRRYPSAAALGADLRRWLAGEAIEARRDSGLYMLRKSVRRYRVPLAVVGTMLLLLGLYGIQSLRVSAIRAQNEQNRLRADLETERSKNAVSSADLHTGSVYGLERRVAEAERLIWGRYFQTFTTSAGPAIAPGVTPENGIVDRRPRDRLDALWCLRELYQRDPCLRTVRLDPGSRPVCAVDAERRLLRIADADGRMTEVELPAGVVRRRWELPTRTGGEGGSAGPIGALVFGSNGRTLLVTRLAGSSVQRVELHDLERSVVLASHRVEADLLDEAAAPAISEVGSRVQVAALTREGRIWLAGGAAQDEGTTVVAGPRLPSGIRVVQLSAIGDALIACDDSGGLHALDIGSGRWASVPGSISVPAHTQGLRVTLASATEPADRNDRRLVVAVGDRLHFLQSADAGPSSSAVPVARVESPVVALAPSGRECFVGGADGRVSRFDALTGEKRGYFAGHAAAIRAVAVLPEPPTVISLDESGVLKLWTDERDSWPRRVRVPDGGRLSVNFAAGDSGTPVRVLARSAAGQVWSWDPSLADPAVPVAPVEFGAGFAARGTPMSLSASARRALFVASHDKAEVMDLVTGQGTILDGFAAAHQVIWSLDDSSLAAFGRDGLVRAWSLKTSPATPQFDPKQLAEVASLGPTGWTLPACITANQRILIGGYNGEITLLSLKSGDFMGRGPVATGPITAVAAVPRRASGDHELPLDCAAADHSIVFFDSARGGMEMWTLQVSTLAESARIVSLAFSSDGRWLAAGADDGTLMAWDLFGHDRHVVGNLEVQLRQFLEQGAADVDSGSSAVDRTAATEWAEGLLH